MADIHYFTEEGLEKLKQELAELKSKGRSDIAKAIAEARDKGDLSENAEYDAAKDAQGMHEMRIAKLEETLAGARLIDPNRTDTGKIMIMSNVTVKNLGTKQTSKFILVSEKEADIKTGKISVGSPIGKGLLGKSVGEVAEISVPSGQLKLQIVEISLG